MARRLTRYTPSAVLGGVAAGFAKYFDLDPTLVRIGFIILGLLQGIGVIAYLVCWVLMPREDAPAAPAAVGPSGAGTPSPSPGSPSPGGTTPADRFAEEVRQAGERTVATIRSAAEGPGRGRILGGSILIALGALFLLDRVFHYYWHFWPFWMSVSRLWPLLVIAVGIGLMAGALRRRSW